MTRPRPRSRKKQVQKNQIWTGILKTNTALADPAQDNGNIVQFSDWTGAIGFERATVKTIRGTITVRNTEAVTGSAMFAIWKINQSETVPNINSINSYIDEDVLWTWSAMFTSSATSQVQAERVNIQTMRRIDVNSLIVIGVKAVGCNLQFSYNLRALVAKDA